MVSERGKMSNVYWRDCSCFSNSMARTPAAGRPWTASYEVVNRTGCRWRRPETEALTK